MTSTFSPATTSHSRVWLIEGRARGDHKPGYESCLRMTGLARGLGDITPIECPDPYKYGGFITIGVIKGASARATTTLEGRFALSLKSTLLELARKGCANDVQLHLGLCQDPSDYDAFEKIIILEDARLTNYGTGDLGALASGDDASVNETADISAEEFYEVSPIGYSEKAASIVTNEVIDVVICDVASCGECTTESDGCKKIFAITKAAGGSVGTPPDIVYSLDKGLTWLAYDIGSLLLTESPTAVDCLGDYIVVVSNQSNSLHYALKSQFNGYSVPFFTEIGTGFVASKEPNDIFSIGGKSFIVADGGYVYVTTNPTAGVTVLDAGVATADDLFAVHALNEFMAVAVGDNGAVIYTRDGENWVAATRPVGLLTDLLTVWVKTENEWWVGATNGYLYYTIDGGVTWTRKSTPSAGLGVINDLVFSTDSVGWVSQTIATKGYIYRTYDGGYSWSATPEKSGTTPSNDQINQFGYCAFDPNFIVAVGLGDNAVDGIIIVGSS